MQNRFIAADFYIPMFPYLFPGQRILYVLLLYKVFQL